MKEYVTVEQVTEDLKSLRLDSEPSLQPSCEEVEDYEDFQDDLNYPDERIEAVSKACTDAMKALRS